MNENVFHVLSTKCVIVRFGIHSQAYIIFSIFFRHTVLEGKNCIIKRIKQYYIIQRKYCFMWKACPSHRRKCGEGKYDLCDANDNIL